MSLILEIIKLLKMTEVLPLFSTPLYRSKISIDNQSLFDRISSEKFVDTDNNKFSKRTLNTNLLLEKEYEDIYKLVVSHLNNFVYKKLNLDCILKCNCSWALIGAKGSVTDLHLHPNAIFSGIYYVKSNKDNGHLHFSVPQSTPTYCSSTVQIESKQFNYLNAKAYAMEALTGDIFIFPSHMYHNVTENKSSEERCAISFNFFVYDLYCGDPTAQLKL